MNVNISYRSSGDGFGIENVADTSTEVTLPVIVRIAIIEARTYV